VSRACPNCHSAEVKQNDRCPACRMWRRRHHEERPEHVIIKHNVRVHEGKRR
jgi:RNA polymerase subunit RPABC4/transcription elongation factor Spt4